MKTTNKKRGFTIVELVIVIAVIAILAAVLIPTFSGAVQKAKDSAALQEATAAYKMVLSVTPYATIATADDDTTIDAYIEVDGNWFSVEDGEVEAIGDLPTTVKKVDAKPAATDDDGIYYIEASVFYTDCEADGVYLAAKFEKAAGDDPATPEVEPAKAEVWKLLGGDI